MLQIFKKIELKLYYVWVSVKSANGCPAYRKRFASRTGRVMTTITKGHSITINHPERGTDAASSLVVVSLVKFVVVSFGILFISFYTRGNKNHSIGRII